MRQGTRLWRSPPNMDLASGRRDPVISVRKSMRCRHCGTRLQHSLIDLGMSPLCASFLTQDQNYPLHARVCYACWLVQLPEFVSPAAEGLRGLVMKLGLHQFLNDHADAASVQINSAYADLVRLTWHDPAIEICNRFYREAA